MTTDKERLIESLTELIELEKESGSADLCSIDLSGFAGLDQEAAAELLSALKRFSDERNTAEILKRLKDRLQTDAF